MKLELLDLAMGDLIEGYHFYELQEAGLGTYFLDTLYSDIDSLRIFGGIHRKAHKKPPLRPVQALSIRHLLHLGIGNRPRAIHRELPEKSILDPATSQECLMAASREMQSG